MRLRTLPVSVAGVLAGIACAIMGGTFSLVPAVLCLLFAMLAQVASNFGNEYYDYVNGLDRKGREGFRRGVTEGDISPRAMKIATYATLAVAAVVGCSMLFFCGWWLLPVGIAIGLFALAYSAGPYPLSHHGLGDVAVVVFFGIVPVTLGACASIREGSIPRATTVGATVSRSGRCSNVSFPTERLALSSLPRTSRACKGAARRDESAHKKRDYQKYY